MPGLVLYDRRWGVGSDDCIVPASLLSVTHLVWIIVLIPIIIITFTTTNNLEENITDTELHYRGLLLVYLSVYVISVVVEVSIIIVSLRGSVINDQPRDRIRALIYTKQALMFGELLLVSLSAKWLSDRGSDLTTSCGSVVAGLIITNSVIFILIILLTWCAWDKAGKSWVKLKKFQESSQRTSGLERVAHNGSKKSGTGFSSRNWRQRKVRRAYENSWDQRCRMFFCCSLASNNKIKSSFAEIARLLSEFFRDLDVVPSDVLAGLILLRQRQQAARQHIISQPTNNVYDFLSGVKVTNDTKFIALDNPSELSVLLDTVHYMHYAMAAYGWPMYVYSKNTSMLGSVCKLCCCPPCCCAENNPEDDVIVDDNCCNCNMNAMKKVLRGKQIEVVYGTFHVDVGETPFFISVDFTKRVIVITIRGTLSMKDIITDLNAECELIPLQNINHDWKGHKGMVQSAEYIYNKLKSESLLSLAYNHRPEAGTHKFPVVCTGHSLGGGTAAILTILLRDREVPDVTCFAFSPPGGLISEKAMLESQSFITSVVVGKDIVPRIGLHQLEILRHQLQQTLHQTKQAKWITISSSFPCCHPHLDPDSSQPPDLPVSKSKSALHQPLYPPGRIIHIVRQWRRSGKTRSSEPAYQGVWADNKDFDQVLISKRMLQDHMPDNVLDALEKASQVHAWHSAVNTVNITRNKNIEKQPTKDQQSEVSSLCIRTETTKTYTLDTVVMSESFVDDKKVVGEDQDVTKSQQAESVQNYDPDCDLSVNKSISLQNSSNFSQISGKNKKFLETLQYCDKKEVKPSSSCVFTSRSETSEEKFLKETTLLTQEISSFYDISTSSTV